MQAALRCDSMQMCNVLRNVRLDPNSEHSGGDPGGFAK